MRKSADTARAECARDQAWRRPTIEALLPHRTFTGNRPKHHPVAGTVTAFARRADRALRLKVFVQGVIWGINSFDQWGVGFGKQLEGRLTASSPPVHGRPSHDTSTLMALMRRRCGDGGTPANRVPPTARGSKQRCRGHSALAKQHVVALRQAARWCPSAQHPMRAPRSAGAGRQASGSAARAP